METFPRVVACVPAWNAAAFVARTVTALQCQDYPQLRILISVDASDDETGALCAALAADDPRLQVVRQPARLGWVANSNALLRLAEGEFAFFAPHDDVAHPSHVRRMIEVLRERPRAALAFGDLARVDVDGATRILRYTLLEGVASAAERARRLASEPVDGNGWTVAYRGVFRLRDARAIGGLRRHFGGEFAADWPWLMALAVRGEICRVPEVTYTKYLAPTTLSAGWQARARERSLGREFAGAAWSCVRAIHGGEFGLGAKLRCDAILLRRAARAWLGAAFGARAGWRRWWREHRPRRAEH